MKTEYLTEPREILENSVVAVGSFDGLHRGHWAIINEVLSQAEKSGINSAILTFDPHPRTVVGEGGMHVLTTTEQKLAAIAAHGVDLTVVVKFDRDFAALTAERFVNDYLVGSLGVRELVMGTDHGFGKGRGGDLESLRKLGQQKGFSLRIVEPVLSDGEPIKSRRIRDMISKGDIRGAAHMLGRPYPVAGEIIPGKGRGKRLGFPTANIRTEPEKLLPPPGVYIAIDGAGKPGLLYIGTSPTFGDVEMGIEFHRIDPKNYKIGGSIEISIFERIRGEIKFENERKLVAQMEKDKDKLTEWALNSGAKVQVKK